MIEYDFYLCGPMKGYPQHNFPAFHQAATMLRNLGYKVCSPAELHGPYQTLHESNRNAYLRKDIEQLTKCRYLVRLPGWENSKGAAVEIAVANALDIKVLDIADVPLWWKRDTEL